jgi:hypothetical protein
VVTDIAIFFAVAVIIAGIFYKFALIPINGAAEMLQNPYIYVETILGG